MRPTKINNLMDSDRRASPFPLAFPSFPPAMFHSVAMPHREPRFSGLRVGRGRLTGHSWRTQVIRYRIAITPPDPASCRRAYELEAAKVDVAPRMSLTIRLELERMWTLVPTVHYAAKTACRTPRAPRLPFESDTVCPGDNAECTRALQAQ